MTVCIKHSKGIGTTRIEELQSSLEAQELRLAERNSEKKI